MIRCEFRNCVHYCADKTCELESISLDDSGGCMDAAPLHTCGECAKFGTERCHAVEIGLGLKFVDAGDSICEERWFEEAKKP